MERGGNAGAIPVVLYGAGDEAEQFARAMSRSRRSPYRVMAMIDPRGRRAGQHIRGVDVVDGRGGIGGALDRLPDKNAPPQRLILTFDRVAPEVVREALDAAERHGMSLAQLGRLTDFAEGGEEVGQVQLKPVALEDLLGRPQTAVDRDSIAALVTGKRILVTGAGGTIGGELSRQIAALAPAEIALVDNSEYALYEIDMEISRRFPELKRRAMLRDIRDRARLDRAFAQIRPDIVFHAAALKHVPLSEANVNETVLTNVGGTMNVADACRDADVGTMVLISTDKAVKPSSVMGATKRLAESYAQALDLAARDGDGTRFVTVRFGNVLGSTGSVVPLFQKQIAAGGPVTVTDPNVTRYFMSVREAVELVLQASAIGEGDASACGRIFELEMGEPVRILDLARQMIRLAGKRPDEDIVIAFSGLRPGEKLEEELLHAGEDLIPTSNPNLCLAHPRTADLPLLQRALDELEDACRSGRQDAVMPMIRRLVPEYGREEERNALSG
jgi:O-antigen biosynthesis protein WbqV